MINKDKRYVFRLLSTSVTKLRKHYDFSYLAAIMEKNIEGEVYSIGESLKRKNDSGKVLFVNSFN